jgi:hypothetical protein
MKDRIWRRAKKEFVSMKCDPKCERGVETGKEYEEPK